MITNRSLSVPFADSCQHLPNSILIGVCRHLSTEQSLYAFIKANISNDTWIHIYPKIPFFIRKYSTMVTCQIHEHFLPNAYFSKFGLIIQFIVKFNTPILFITALTCFYSNWNNWHNIEQHNPPWCMFLWGFGGLLATRSTNLVCSLFITYYLSYPFPA